MTKAEFKALREKMGMTQAKLAEKLGVRALTIKRIEKKVDAAILDRRTSLAMAAIFNEWSIK
jgi:DNA-binding XRE family transcriptional regulator